MQNETISPINHGVISGAGQTAAGALGGAVRTGTSTYLKTALASTVIGAGLFVVIGLTGGVGALAAGGSAFSGILGNALGGSLVGGLLGGLVIGPFAGSLGGIFGAAKGGSDAAQRVREEKGAANMMQAQLSAMQAQALANQASPITISAPEAYNDNKYASASTLKLAPTTIQQGADAQLDGMVHGAALQRA